METSQRGRSRKCKINTAKNFRNMIKRSLAFMMCFGIVLTNMNTTAVFADEIRMEIIPDDDETYRTEEDNEIYDDGYDNGRNDTDESSSDEDPLEDMKEEDEEPEDGSESEPDGGTGTGSDEEETDGERREETGDDTETEDTGEEDDTGIDEGSEYADGEAEVEPLPYDHYATSYKNVSARIYTDETYEEILADGTAIELSGKMPKGAVVKAYPVEVEIEDITVLAAYDITIFDGDGEVYEPDEDDVIEVTIENDEIREAIEEEIELTVLHMDDEEDEPEEIVRLPRKTKKARFRARHFSIYIVGTDDELYELDGKTPHFVYLINFYLGDVEDPDDENGYHLLSTQKVSPGEKAETPSVPDRDGYEFSGWYTEPGGRGDLYETYKGVMPDIPYGTEDDIEIDLYAHYSEAYTVHYMTHDRKDDASRVIFHSELYKSGQALDTTDAEELYLAEGYLSYIDEVSHDLITALAVTGWKDADDNGWKTGDKIDWDNINGALELYPVVEAACWIYFDMNDHDSLYNPAPEYVLASETFIGELPEPSVSGYSFGGWFTEPYDGERVTKDTVLADISKNRDGSITLYAHWDENYTAYTVNIWRQKATDGKAGITNKEIRPGETRDDYIDYYDYAESHYVSADQSRLKTGETPTTSSVDSWGTYTGYESTSANSNNYRNHPEYYGFEYSNTTAQTRTVNELATVTMASDGSTIINIYYNRVTITWNFGTQQNSTRTGTLIGLYDTNVSLADDVEPGGTLSSWPANSNNSRWSATTSSLNTTFKAKFDLDNGTTVNWTESSASTSRYLYFYLEVTNEDTQVDVNGSKAQEASDYGVAYTRTVNSTLYVYNQRTGTSGNFNFTDKYIGYYLAGYIDNINGSTQTAYTSASAGGSHTFRNNGYIFNNAVTDNTITLISNDKVVGVDAAGDAVTTTRDVTYPRSDNDTVKYGTAMSSYPFPETLDGAAWGPAYYYDFTGWYGDPTCTSDFSITTMPNNNVAAYAGWELKNITVTFTSGTKEVEDPVGQVIKATEKAVDPGELKREGYTHVGWIDSNGKVFNFDTVLYSDTALKAIWKADDESGYTIQYDLNVDNSYSLFDGYTGDTTAVNDEHFTEEEEVWTIEKAFPNLEDTNHKDAYDMFIGWNTAADGTGTMYYPDDVLSINDSNIVVDDGSITLYAVWAHRNESTLVLLHNYPDGYVPAAGDTGLDILTSDNLTSVDLASVSGLEYHHEITVEDHDGTIHTYRFDGWSTADPGDDPTDEDVDIGADETVAADTLYTNEATRANYLFAVWLEVHDITVTKEVVNDLDNYTIPDDTVFGFSWSFVDGENITHTNKETIEIADGESFIIPDVASGESVTITENRADGFMTSYNGAHSNVNDDGKGTYTFTMDDDSREITVTNTVITYWTVEKELINKDEDATGKDGTYTIGDTAEFRITVTNISDAPIGKIEVTEILEGAVFKDPEDGTYTLNNEKTAATIEDLAAGASAVLCAEYTIEEKDIGAYLSNSVTTSGGDPDDEKPGPDGKADIPTEEPEDEGGDDPGPGDEPGEEMEPDPEEPDESSGDEEPESDPEPESGSESGSGSGSGSGGSGSGSHGSSSYTGNVRNVNTGKTGHWILEGGYLTLPDGSHPSNEYLDVDGEVWAFYTYGYAVNKRHTQYYTDEAIAAAGYIPEVAGTWETIGWWFEYDDGTYPHDEWALLEYNGLTYWYHFDVDGWMDDGWFTGNGNTYYLDPVFDGWRGHMMTGWQMIGGYWYYFSEDPNSLGVMLKDTTTPDGSRVDENGRWIGD